MYSLVVKHLKYALGISCFILSIFISNHAFAADPFILTDEEKAFIRQSERITVSYDAFWPPFERQNPETKTLEGINYEILMLIADVSGLKFEFMHGLTYAQALDSLSHGNTDMHLSYDTNPVKAREYNALLSDTFLSTPIAMIGKSYDISKDSVFAVSELLPVTIRFVKEAFPKHQVLILKDIDAAYKAVDSGVADFTFENIYAARAAISRGGYPLLRIVNLLPVYDRFSFLFSEDVDPRLISIFNKAIASFPENRFSEILLYDLTKTSYASQFVQLLSYASVNLLVGIIFLLIMLLIVLFVYTSKQRSMQKNLRTRQKNVQNMLDTFPMPIFISDMETYKLIYCNKTAYEFMGSDNIESQRCHEILQDLDEPCPFCTNDIIQQRDDPFTWNRYDAAKDKHLQYVDACVAWDDKDRVRLSIITDITEILNLQKERVLEQEANIAKGQFLANMSHEIRTPLNGILGMTHLAMDVNKESKVSSYLEKINSSSENLLNIVNDILDFSKIESGKMEIEHTTFSIYNIINNVKANLEVSAQSKGIEFNTKIAKNVPEFVIGDPLRLTQIIFNIAGNAVKFTKQGSVSISLDSFSVEEDSEKLGICLAIKDTGVGISEEKLGNIFTEFSQADLTTTRMFGGTGLGLTISKSLAQMMGGDIRVESVLGEGSTFICTLVFDYAHNAPIESEQKSLDEIQDLNGVKVLLAEDNEINSIIATELLQKIGCKVTYAENGLEAMKMIHKTIFDIVLMDIQMPIMDGLTASKQIRLDAQFNSLPIIAVSAHAMLEDRQKSIEAGMQEHITKPFKPLELYNTIKKYTSQHFVYKAN